MSVELGIKAIVDPVLAALTPAVHSLYTGRVPELQDDGTPTTEYVVMSGVTEPTSDLDDLVVATKQLTIVTRDGMDRAREIKDALFAALQRAKGVFASCSIAYIAYLGSVELPDGETGEDIIASDYQVTYQGGVS